MTQADNKPETVYKVVRDPGDGRIASVIYGPTSFHYDVLIWHTAPSWGPFFVFKDIEMAKTFLENNDWGGYNLAIYKSLATNVEKVLRIIKPHRLNKTYANKLWNNYGSEYLNLSELNLLTLPPEQTYSCQSIKLLERIDYD